MSCRETVRLLLSKMSVFSLLSLRSTSVWSAMSVVKLRCEKWAEAHATGSCRGIALGGDLLNAEFAEERSESDFNNTVFSLRYPAASAFNLD